MSPSISLIDGRGKLITIRVGPVVRYKMLPVRTWANNLPDPVKLIGALINWLLLGALTMQLCEYTADGPFLPLPNLTVNTDVYYLCFPRDSWLIKFTGTSGPLSTVMVMLNSGQHMVFIC